MPCAASPRRVEHVPRLPGAHDAQCAVGGQPAALRLHTFTPPGAAAAVFQLQALFYAPSPETQPTRDLVQLHATCAARELAEGYAPAFEALIASFAFS